MGFYGNITNTSRTQFQFDRTYPNRKVMDANAKVDGIYIGRYVLIEYENFLAADWCAVAFQKRNQETGALEFFSSVKTIAGPDGKDIIVPDEVSRLIFGKGNIVEGKYIRVPGLKIDNNGQVIIYNLDNDTITYDTLYYITGAVDEYENPVVKKISEIENSPYNENYNIDLQTYGPGRGYDSTVWQKVYADGEEKYVMIAELNTVVPTFNITPDAPSMSPTVPHIDADSTNIYYNVHWQAPWGLRLKSATSKITTYPIQEDGSSASSNNRIIMSVGDNSITDSDENTYWTKVGYDVKTGEHNKYYYKTIFYDPEDARVEGEWLKLEEGKPIPADGTIPAAIYYNKDGFNKLKISYSDKDMKDRIAVEPIGLSGTAYNTHDGVTVGKLPQVDTQELSIILPSLGNSVAELWDIMYGNEEINGSKERNDYIRWPDGSIVQNDIGLSLFKADNSGYNYQPEEVNTLAGAINSVHNLMGTIVQKKVDKKAAELTEEDIKDWNKKYIFYLPEDKQFYRKNKTYTYDEKVNSVSADKSEYYKEITFSEWPEDGYYYIDYSEEYYKGNPVYIKEKEYDSSKTYYNTVTAINPITSFEGGDFVPYTYYVKLEDIDVIDQLGNEIKVNGYGVSKDLVYNKDTDYYTLKITELPDGTQFWGDGTEFYTGIFTKSTNPKETEFNSGVLFILNEQGKYERAMGTFDPSTTVYYTAIFKDATEYDPNLQYFKISQRTEGNIIYIEQIRYEVAKDLTAEDFNPNDPNRKTYYTKNGNEYYIADEYYDNVVYYKKNIELIPIEGQVEVKPEHITEVPVRDITVPPEKGIYCQFRPYNDDGYHQYFIVNASNFKGLHSNIVILESFLVPEMYQPNVYYYKVEDENNILNGSYIFDKHTKMTPGRIYYAVESVSVGKPLDFTEKPIYEPNKYYFQDPKEIYRIEARQEPEVNKVYFKKDGLYVSKDEHGQFPIGMEWNLNVLDIPEGIELSRRKEIWHLEPIKEFAHRFNTIHGLILRLNEILEEDNLLIRDYDTVQGVLNKVKDMFSQFGELRGDEILVTDKYGRITSTTFIDDDWIYTNYENENYTDENEKKVSKIIINHQYIGEETGKGEHSFNENQISHKLAFGETIFNPSFAFKTDDMGHLNKYSTSGVDWTLPTVSYETIIPKENDFGNMVIDMELVPQANNTNLHFIETRQNVGNLPLTDYVSTSTNNVIEVLPIDSINEAFNKVNITFDNLDYKRKTAVETPIFITEINQTNGLITPVERVIHQDIPYVSENYSQADLVSSKGIHDYVIGVTEGLKGGQANHYFNGIIEEEGRLKLQTQEIDNIISQNSTDEAVASPKAVYNYVNKLQCGTEATYVSNITTDDAGNIKPIVNEVSTFISNASLNTDLVTPKAVYNYVNQIEEGNDNTYISKIILNEDGYLKASSTEVSTDMTKAAASNVQLVSQNAVLNYLNNTYSGNTVINSVGTIKNGIWDSTIATDRVITEAIKDAAVTTDKIADNAVTEIKILNNAVTTDKIADNAINNKKIATGVEASKVLLTNYSTSTYETSTVETTDSVLIAFKKLEDRIKELENQIIDLTARIETLETA